MADLRPLFEAERRLLIDALQEAIASLGTATGERRNSLICSLRRDAHRLKGLADVETRDRTSAAVTELERRIDELAAVGVTSHTDFVTIRDAVAHLSEIDGDRGGL